MILEGDWQPVSSEEICARCPGLAPGGVGPQHRAWQRSLAGRQTRLVAVADLGCQPMMLRHALIDRGQGWVMPLDFAGRALAALADHEPVDCTAADPQSLAEIAALGVIGQCAAPTVAVLDQAALPLREPLEEIPLIEPPAVTQAGDGQYAFTLCAARPGRLVQVSGRIDRRGHVAISEESVLLRSAALDPVGRLHRLPQAAA